MWVAGGILSEFYSQFLFCLHLVLLCIFNTFIAVVKIYQFSYLHSQHDSGIKCNNNLLLDSVVINVISASPLIGFFLRLIDTV